MSDSSVLVNVGMGQYTIVVTDASGCSSSQTVSLEITGVSEPESKSNLVQIVPNPAKEKAFILLQQDMKGPCDIHISNPEGRTVQTLQHVDVQQGQIVLDIRSYPAGTYFVRIDIDSKIFTKRLLVIR